MGFGCLGMVAIFLLLVLSIFSGGGGSVASLLLVGILIFVVVLAVKQSKKPKSDATIYNAPTSALSIYANSIATNEAAGQHGFEGEFVKSPLCHHTFPKRLLDEDVPLECSCGYHLDPADLRELEEIKAGMRKLEARRGQVMQRVQAGQLGKSSASAKAEPVAKTTVKPKVAKPRRAISTQQWLVIGASILIFVAGMVFVSTNLNRLPQWAFQLITGGIAVAAGLGSVYMRKISSLLASFFTAFSAAMQLAFLAILGDQLNEGFLWNNAPAWWWLISLGVIAVIAGTMAKLTRIFGWKALALLATASSALVLELGVLLNQFEGSAATVHLAILTVTAVATLWLAKALRGIPSIVEKDDALKAYAEDLNQREDASLRWFAVGAAGLQLTVGLGIFAVQYLPVAVDALQPLPLIALAAVWFGVAATAARWSGQLRQNGEQLGEFAAISRYVMQLAAGLAVVSASLLVGNLWIALVTALAGLVVINLASGRIAAITPSAFTSLSVFGVASLAWGLWASTSSGYVDAPKVLPLFLIGASKALALSEYRYRINKFAWVTGAGFSAGLIWLGVALTERVTDSTGWLYALITIALALAANLPLVLRQLVARRAEGRAPVGFEWLGLAAASTVAITQLALAGTSWQSVTVLDLVPMITVLLVYATGALVLGAGTEYGRGHTWLLQSHSYLAQGLVLVLIFASAGSQLEIQDWVYAGLLLFLGLLNYGYGWIRKQVTSLQVGFGYVIASVIPVQNLAHGGDISIVALVAILVITAMAFGHEGALRRRTELNSGLVQTSMLTGLGIGLFLMLGTQWAAWTESTLGQQLLVQGLLWLIALATSIWNWVSSSRSKSISASIWWVSIIYVVFAAAISLLGNAESELVEILWQWSLSALVIGLTLAINHRSRALKALVPLALVANLIAGWWAGGITSLSLKLDVMPEPYTLWMAVALVGTTLLIGGPIFGLRTRLLLDIPVLGVAVGSFGKALWDADPQSNETLLRGILSLAVIAGFAYWRSGRELPEAWLAVGYLAGAGSSVYLTHGFALWTGWDYDGPEPLAAFLGASVAIGNYFAAKNLGARFAELRTVLMLVVLTLPTLVHSVFVAQDLVDARLRQILALAVVAGVALWRIQIGKSLYWGIPGYLASLGSMLAIANLLHARVWTDFSGPELYSLPVLVAVLVGHAFFLPRVMLKSSWVAWGVPMGVGLLPSAFDTAVVASTPFEDLTAMQITRVLLVLAISIGLLVFGVRLGNLANTAVGLAGLALLLVPNTALQSDRFLAGTAVESTALIIGALVFIALAVARRQGLLRGRSTIFIGIPVAIIMAPALVRSLLALANPSLTGVDWWRFGILLAAGLTLLIVGSLRELGGMFFPGLASVLLTALPYAFMQSKDQEWFLWVVLLIVATAMIWVALRLEKLRKLGRDSANWVRELK